MNSKANGSGARTCDTMMRDALLHALQQEVAVDGCIMSKMQAIARQLVAMALVGDMRAIKEIFDRIDGKARPAVVAREQPTEAQAGIGLKEQLRRLTAWDFPPPAAAGSDEQCDAIGGYAATVRDRQRHCLPASDRRAVRLACFVTERREETSACLALRSGAGKPVGSGRFGRTSQRENPRAMPDVDRESAARSEAARNGRGDEMALTGFAARADAPPSPLWRAKTLEGPDPRCFA